MEKPIFPNTLDNLSFNQVGAVKNNEGGCTAILPIIHKEGICVEADLESSLKSNKLVKTAGKYFEKTQRYMCVHLKTTAAEPNQITVGIHGFFSHLSMPDHLGPLKIRLGLTLNGIEINGGSIWDSCVINQEMDVNESHRKLQGRADDSIETCIGKEPYFETTKHRVGNRLSAIFSYVGSRTYSINGTFRLVMFSDEKVARQVGIFDHRNREMYSDMTIVTSNRSEFKCHRMFLASHSKVFGRMIQTGNADKIDMSEMTEEGATALLDFLYDRDMKRPMGSCHTALELFQAGHKYEIEALESKMKFLFLNKSDDWYDTVVAWRLFLFAKNVKGCDDLTMKALEVTQAKTKEMLESKAFADLFNGNQAALEFIMFVLDNWQSGGGAGTRKDKKGKKDKKHKNGKKEKVKKPKIKVKSPSSGSGRSSSSSSSSSDSD